jgi:alpha-tubulin suppressor-like RCC1 family protein
VFSVANIRALSAGETHTCVITLGGAAICSGGNDRGQLGNGAVAPGAIAVNVDAGGGRPSLWSAVATGERHTCGMPRFNPAENLFGPGVIRPSQRIWCWGANDHGQLGNATFRDTAVADTVKLPNLIPAFIGFDSMSVVAGASHTCALEAAGNAGRVLCWGSNAFGQLGLGAIDTLAHSAPRVAAVPEPLVRLYAGENHTCGVTAAGVVYCWGRNERGQLNGTASVPVPTPTVVGVPSMRALALGELFTCGITGVPGVPGTTSPAGTIHCWGDNEFGQLGRGSFSANAHPPLAAAPIKGQ